MIRPKISRLRQSLTGGGPSHPKAFLYHEYIRVSFLWTTLWGNLGTLESPGDSMVKKDERKMPDSL
jgi:hypothetical protein